MIPEFHFKDLAIAPARKEIGWCGPASLAGAAVELGLPEPDQYWLAKSIGTTFERGTSGDQMLEGARLLGLTAEWVQKNLEELHNLKLTGAAVILNWMSGPDELNDGHYSLLLLVNEIFIVLNDSEFVGMVKVFYKNVFSGIWYDIDGETGEKLERWALVVKRIDNQIP